MALVSLSSSFSVFKSSAAAAGVFAIGGATLPAADGTGILALGAGAAAGLGGGRAGLAGFATTGLATTGTGASGCVATIGRSGTVSGLPCAQPVVSSNSRTAM